MTTFEITPDQLHTYKARVRSIYDADTFRLDIDLGCYVWLYNESVRLGRVDAWELRGAEREKGLLARDWLASNMPEGSDILVRTNKDKKGKYGRYIVDVCHPVLGDLAEAMVNEGHAEWWKYN